MGVISAHNNVKYIDSSQLLSRIKRELKSFDQLGLIDGNDFYDYVMDVLKELHMGGYMEKQAILEIKDNKARLPDHFKYLYSANLCKLRGNGTNTRHPQNGYVFYTDTLYEPTHSTHCKKQCEVCDGGYKVTVREYIEGIEDIRNYHYDEVCPLRVVPSSAHYCVDGYNRQHNNYYGNKHSISIDGDYITTDFPEGTIYIKYYALPIDDESGLPLIPDDRVIQKAIQYYSIYQYFLNFYWNDEVPNGTAQKAAESKKMYSEAMGQAISQSKLPHFGTLVDSIRIQRSKLNIYQQLDRF